MRIKDLLSEEKAAIPPKPRNFVAKNAKMGGAGQHKDKKKAEKQGDVKHKKELATMESALDEISLGDYRKKAAMQKAQSQMGAMFNNDPEKKAKDLATFYKREKGLNRVKDRDERSRKSAADQQMADNIAKLPELKAEYERMKAEYKSLGGSNWQYADREQNLSDGERKARAMEGPMNNLWRTITAAEKAQGATESVEEAVEDRISYQVAKVLFDHGIKYDPAREDELIKVIELALVKKLDIDPRQVRGIMNDEDFLGDTMGELRNMEQSA